MTTKKKLLIVVGVLVAMAALVAGSVFGTIAYLAAASRVSNVFTYGEVFISMDESKVDQHGNRVEGGGRTDNNSYLLMPGESYVKDPQIHVQANTQPCYLFLVTRNEITEIEASAVTPIDGKPTMAQQMVANGWGIYKDTSVGSRVWIYCGNSNNVYHNAVDESADNYAAAGSTNYMHAKTPVAVCGTNNASMADGTTIIAVAEGTSINIFEEFHVTSEIGTELSIYSGAQVTLNAIGIQASVFGEIGNSTSINEAWAAVVNQFPYIQDNVAPTEGQE